MSFCKGPVQQHLYGSNARLPVVPAGFWIAVNCTQNHLRVKKRPSHGCRRRYSGKIGSASKGTSADIKAAGEVEGQGKGLSGLLTPLSNPAANAKLVALCSAQMLSSIATLMHDTYLPIYMTEVLCLSNTSMGNLHALLQFVARASGVISGRLADVLSCGRMVIVGTALTALCKPMFALSGVVHAALGAAGCIAWITTAKLFDRASKGIREAPSKALIGDLAAQSGDSAAAAFSLRQSFSTFGMLSGATLASTTFKLSGRSFVTTFALASVPAALALLVIMSAMGSKGAEAEANIMEKTVAQEQTEDGESPDEAVDKGNAPSDALGSLQLLLQTLTPAYWQALAVVCLLYVARFDTAFITVRASAFMDATRLPLLNPFMMIPVVLLAAPVGARAKTSVTARNTAFFVGVAFLIAGDLTFALIPSVKGMILGALCVGMHMAITQGVCFGMLASYIPSQPMPGLGKISGTVWSITDLILGVALACSNALAGRLSDITAMQGLGTMGCFFGGVGACVLSMIVLLLFTYFGALGDLQLPGKQQAHA